MNNRHSRLPFTRRSVNPNLKPRGLCDMPGDFESRILREFLLSE